MLSQQLVNTLFVFFQATAFYLITSSAAILSLSHSISCFVLSTSGGKSLNAINHRKMINLSLDWQSSLYQHVIMEFYCILNMKKNINLSIIQTDINVPVSSFCEMNVWLSRPFMSSHYSNLWPLTRYLFAQRWGSSQFQHCRGHRWCS